MAINDEITIFVSRDEWDGPIVSQTDTIEGVEIKGPSIVKSAIGSVLVFVLTHLDTISTSLVSAYLFERFRKHKITRMTIRKRAFEREISVDGTEIQRVIEEMKQIDNEK